MCHITHPILIGTLIGVSAAMFFFLTLVVIDMVLGLLERK